MNRINSAGLYDHVKQVGGGSTLLFCFFFLLWLNESLMGLFVSLSGRFALPVRTHMLTHRR